MPSQLPSLSTDEAVRFIEGCCFPEAGNEGNDGPGTLRCGVEIEWLTTPLGDPRSHLPAEEALRVVETVGDLPGCSKVTLEPGGQVELSSAPGSPADVCRLMAVDARVARRRLAGAGVGMVGVGLDPVRPPRRVLQYPRYAAMEQFFDHHGPAGRTMMCSTAAIQVNLSLGSGEEQEARWRQANLIGPTMTAAFANSPFLHGEPSGWRSSRAAVWRMLDLSRTSPVPLVGNAANAWARYALNAQVMLVRDASGAFLPDLEHLTFGAWMAKGHAAGFPTVDDLRYHLTTLFPPVRPRGWLELRFVDTLGEPWWPVPLLVAAAIVCDQEAAETARSACQPASTLWVEAARHGLGHPVLAKAAQGCFTAAIDALDRIGADPAGREAVGSFMERFVANGRCPADDLLDAWAVSGELYPEDRGQPPDTLDLMEPAWTIS